MRKILMIFSFVVLTLMVNAQYTTIQSGLWSDAATWSGDSIPDNTKENIISISTGTVITADNLIFSKSTIIIIHGGGELIINTIDVNHDVAEAHKDFFLNVMDGGLLTINGDFSIAKDANLIIDGNVFIDGNLELGKGATIIVDEHGTSGGTLIISGNLLAGAGFDLSGCGIVIANGEVLLDVELIEFYGNYNFNKTILYWSTASEKNNDYFLIEYSIDAINWNDLDKVYGNGNSTTKINYTYNFYTNDSYYYRLKQVDYDGVNETFSPIFIQSDIINVDRIYDIFDISGKLIRMDKGGNIENLQKGIYILRNNEEFHKIMIK